MNENEINAVVAAQKEFFRSGKTLDVKSRKKYLQRLKEAIHAREEEINRALKEDLGKSECESYMCEVGLSLSELSYQIKHISSFVKKQRVRTPLAQFAAVSYRYPSPYGTVLVMSPWNYPFLLSVEPLTEAIAAGNTVVLKPSAYSPHTDEVMKKILSEVFPPEYVTVIEGGREENRALINADFDYIFFTGSKSVGRYVNESAAKRMIPVTLELGGKSPCIVDSTAKTDLAARRIVFGKYLNCGQTCVAPDYILCKKEIKEKLIESIEREIVRQYGERPLQNENYGKIITEKHFRRVKGLIDGKKVVFGGKSDESALRIEPTVMDGVTWEDPVMQEEIFGPVLPVLTYENTEEAIKLINGQDPPLALYIFSSDKGTVEEVLARVPFGGGCVNDVVIHLATSYMPFGGYRQSGIGGYHGKKGFETFTHYKSVVDKKTFMDLPMRYQPYKKLYDKLIRFFLR